MARRRGPIGRVRNIRNVDLGGIPLPYPVMFVPYVIDVTDYVLTVGYFRQDSNVGVVTADVARYSLSGWQSLVGGLADSVVIPAISDFVVQIDFTTVAPVTGDLVGPLAWETGKRGVQGEWFAPALLTWP